MDKKAQGLPITTIVIAVLALLVLVVIGAIFGGQIFKFGIGASTCQDTCIYTNAEARSYAGIGGTDDVSPAPDLFSSSWFDMKEANECPSGYRALSGKYVARYATGVDPKKHGPFTCKACCVYGG